VAEEPGDTSAGQKRKSRGGRLDPADARHDFLIFFANANRGDGYYFLSFLPFSTGTLRVATGVVL
jgi:hypothetical protein